MTTFYDEMAAVATDMINEFGTEFTLRSVAVGAPVYDPVTGDVIETDPIDTPFRGVLMNTTQEYAQSMAQGVVQARDMLVLMEPDVRKPEMTDSVVMEDGEVWQVVNIKSEKPGGRPLYYLLQVRP